MRRIRGREDRKRKLGEEESRRKGKGETNFKEGREYQREEGGGGEKIRKGRRQEERERQTERERQRGEAERRRGREHKVQKKGCWNFKRGRGRAEREGTYSNSITNWENLYAARYHNPQNENKTLISLCRAEKS